MSALRGRCALLPSDTLLRIFPALCGRSRDDVTPALAGRRVSAELFRDEAFSGVFRVISKLACKLRVKPVPVKNRSETCNVCNSYMYMYIIAFS